MQKPVKRLGRGLSSLISVPETPVAFPPPAPAPAAPAAAGPADGTPTAPAAQPAQAPAPGPQLVDVAAIRPNPYQPRRDIAPEALQALAESIRKTGLIQPIIVRPLAGGAYELIAGERRWRASQMAGLTRIPAVVREATETEMLEMALVENIFREDLNAIDRAGAYRRYCDEFQLSADEVATRLGEDRTTVTNYLRLLDLPNEVKAWVAEGRLSMGHARALLGIKSPSDLVRTAKQAIDEGLSVRALEKLVRERVEARAAAAKPAADGQEAKRPQIRNLEQAFVRAIGTKVEIQESRKKGSGKIIIHYYNLDDFDRIAERFGVEEE
jgi:ParB family chromosome partitioning protein